MLASLLHAKLHRPAPTPVAVERQRLLRCLDEGLTSKVTLVSAPAGFGKSTLVSVWIEHRAALTGNAETSVAGKTSWLNLDEADNQLPRFLRYLAAAIEEHFPQSCATVTTLLQEKPLPSIEVLADVLVESLTELSTPLVLVLDDLHLVDEPAIFGFLTRLVQHAPSQFHLILITRVDPALPLNRWRAQGYLHELRHHDLCFNLAETDTFLRLHLVNAPTDEIVATLHERSEGWVVGLRLVALALRREVDYKTVVAGFEANSNRYIIDYLMDDVLDHQPPGVQQFLICTAILTRFCPALCAAILEIDENAAQQHIQHVARANLFLIELSSPAQWYRYHHQFQSMLLSKLHERYDPQAVAMLHRQAAAWLAAHDQVDGALRHLTVIADLVAAAELIESQRLVVLNDLRFDELETWLKVLPPTLVRQRPALLISLAWVQFDQMDNTQCLATVQRASALLQEKADDFSTVTRQILQAELVAMRTALDASLERNEALALIRQSWQQIRPYVTFTHCNVPLWFGYTSQRLGDLDLALSIVLTTLEATSVWPPLGRGRLLHTAGFFYWCGGNVAQSERTFMENLRLGRQHQSSLITMISHHGLGAIADARNQHEVAESHHLEVIKNPHLTNGRDAVMDMYALIVIYARRGRAEACRPHLARLKSHAALVGRPYLINQIAALEAYVALHCGDLATAFRWALTDSRSEMYNGADRIPIIRVQILLAEGSPASLQAAEQLLQMLSRRHESDHSWHRMLEVNILQAMTWHKLERMELALAALGSAVQRAVANGVIGPFIGHGPALIELLYHLGQQAEYAQRVQLLLAAMPNEPRPAMPVTPREHVGPVVEQKGLIEPLTDRELDVLHLLVDRLSNKEIADRLVVSPNTVRNHVVNIFGKLQVENRHQAVERVHALGLVVG